MDLYIRILELKEVKDANHGNVCSSRLENNVIYKTNVNTAISIIIYSNFAQSWIKFFPLFQK